MSKSQGKYQLTEDELKEWIIELGINLGSIEDEEFRDSLRNGVILCQLANTIHPGSVEEIKNERDSLSAEDNILKFLQTCHSLGIEKIFKLADLTDEKRDFSSVLSTLQELYNIADGKGMGLKQHKQDVVEDDTNPTHSTSSNDFDADVEGDNDESGRDTQESPETVVRACFAFTGEGDDELVFEKGDIVTVTKTVEGGWWEGICNGRVGWFPGNYVEDIPAEMLPTLVTTPDKRSSIQQFYDLVINDILETERAYTNNLQTLLSVYLIPLKTSNVLPPSDTEFLTGNLPELSKWQQGFFRSIQECSRLPLSQQNLGSLFLKVANELETLYSTYCANHPRTVAVLTENSDKISSFMESRGAASPGILTLTTSLSKPFKRLDKYPVLLKELERILGEEHSDANNVSQVIDLYSTIATRTQELRKKKETDYEMLSNPVQGFNGQCLLELGHCFCIIQGNQALSSEEVDERFFLVFPDRLVILVVGASLSGYELKSNLKLSTIATKRGAHSECWPHPVEITKGMDTIHVSLFSEKDQSILLDNVLQQQGGQSGRSNAIHRSNSMISKVSVSRSSSTFRHGYNPRMLRKASGPINRAHHWGFMSLRPAPPLKTQQLIMLRDKDAKSPRAGKKFSYPTSKKRRSKTDDNPPSVPNKPYLLEYDKAGDTAILKVIEAYCATGRALMSDKHSMPVRHSIVPVSPTKLPVPSLKVESDYDVITERSTTLPSEYRREKLSFTHQHTFSPTLSLRSDKKGLLRNRSGSFDSHTTLKTKH